jgi:hypothetical protein
MKIFDDLLLKGIRAGQMPAREQSARNWYRDQAKKVGKIDEAALVRDAKGRYRPIQPKNMLGNMYMFMYDPKHKATLPFFDRFPLIFFVGPAKGGFYGINMHYLPLPLRAKLMDALYEITNNTKFNEKTKLIMSYEVLKSTETLAAFRPCFKHYLTEHVRSRPVFVNSSEWDMALFLPTERFESKTKKGISKTNVWADSKKQIQKAKK